MGYSKFVISGNYVEVYEYEKNIPPYRLAPRRSVRRSKDKVLGVGGENVFLERKLGKRRDNANRARIAFARRIRANLGGVDKPVLITLTYAENQLSLRDAYRDFSSFVQALRYRHEDRFKYICVPEFQKRGAVHFHALFWGLPEAVVSSERQTRFLAGLWGRGFVYIKQTDGHEKLSWYLAKYMSKAYLDARLAHYKAYVASRNIDRPRVYSGIAPLYPVLDDYGLSPSDILHEKRFMTYWLGRAVYRRYQKS